MEILRLPEANATGITDLHQEEASIILPTEEKEERKLAVDMGVIIDLRKAFGDPRTARMTNEGTTGTIGERTIVADLLPRSIEEEEMINR